MIYDTEKEREEWRYRFAGMALQGLLANSLVLENHQYALLATTFADALLAELEKK